MAIPTIVTIAQARAHLRIADDASSPASSADLDLALKLRQATEVVIDVVNENVARQHYDDADDAAAAIAAIAAWTPIVIEADGTVTSPSPDTTAPGSVVAAVLMILAELDRFRGDDPGSIESAPQREPGQLSSMARAYLATYLTPVLS